MIKETFTITDNDRYYTVVEVYDNKIAIEKHIRYCDNAKIYDEELTKHKPISVVYNALKRIKDSYKNSYNTGLSVVYKKEENYTRKDI